MKNLMGKDRTILLVDDDADYLATISTHLSAGFGKILTAPNGKEALDLMKVQAVDIVVSDLHMPKMKGVDFIEEIKKRYPLIPIIILTGNITDPELPAVVKNGAFDVVDKCVKFELLENSIKNALIFPLLIQVLWSVMSKEWETPKIEDFMKMDLNEQLKALFAFSALIKTKSLKKDFY